ncbi:bifunctional dihydrofolate reductase-thymidylate synthase [Chloropicon primus]|uniref:Bifunctional dihydrofolate reductase-thymidylate synthase n=1 Tax=Chloropicon primus TaxID=1764295 RepID=A0A5B8MDW6_9CHLO|nr:bifunctional dihydrofolate reductase-thymidylate synthase [Chloropicon primus]UPQ97051.1 bifunctional dihydrofolate reductase-thymidylate synthase [Chloropicon primus]|eukprot:QDZ17835.1 bifunctional dihydrofolate reductase-thymidylate synthase [Chloropicon primus]
MGPSAEQMNAARRGFQIVVAATRQLGIGKKGNLPWKLSGDMLYFKRLTQETREAGKRNAVVMGRNTWESIPKKFRPLPGRLNVVLSRSAQNNENVNSFNTSAQGLFDGEKGSSDVAVHGSLESALEMLASPDFRDSIETVFVIGGGQVYKEALESPLCEAVHLTEIDSDFECDTFFPSIDPTKFRIWSSSPAKRDKESQYSFLCYSRSGKVDPPALPSATCSKHEEYQYLDMIEDIIENGMYRGDRTGTGTFSKFGCQMRFDLRRSFPLLTTKRVFWRGVVEELLWFMRGSTNAKLLQEKNVRIWDGNGSREYLDSIGLTDREEGDLGPVYGFQWRHFGAEYTDMHADYSGQGIDQLAEVIHKIKNNPNDRRIILTAWNPSALKDMALPPCHMMCQFYVANGELSCQMYQRSCDLGLGVPFNIASYSLLTCIIAHVCGLKPGDFVHTLGDAHVYSNHVEPLKEQLQNEPRPFPTLSINTDNKDIEAFSFEDFELSGYEPHKKVAMKMAV